VSIRKNAIEYGIVAGLEQVRNKKRTKVNGIRLRTIGVLTAAPAAVGIGPEAKATSCAQQFQQPRMGRLKPPTRTPRPTAKTANQLTETLKAIQTKRLSALQASIAQAIRRLDAGPQQVTLEELVRARDALASPEKALGPHVKPRFANVRRPTIGSDTIASDVQELTK